MSKLLHFPKSVECRARKDYHFLVTAVDLYAPPGAQFRYQIVASGAPFDPLELPRPAVLIECVGSVRTRPGRSRYSFSELHVLRYFDFKRVEWVERARSLSPGSSWTIDLAPIAHRLLYPQGEAPAVDEARPIAEELAVVITTRLEIVRREVRCHVLADLADVVSREIVRITDSLSVMKVGYGEKAKFPVVGQSAELDDPKQRFRPQRSVA
jgi:hypothetical protein